MTLFDEIKAAHMSVACRQCEAKPEESCLNARGKVVAVPHNKRREDGNAKLSAAKVLPTNTASSAI